MNQAQRDAMIVEIVLRAEKNTRAFLATLDEDQESFFRDCGNLWYNGAHDIAGMYGAVVRGSGQLSAFSPRTAWSTNVRDFHNYQIGIRAASLPKIRVQKCDAIVALSDNEQLMSNILRILNGPKTQAFFHNILFPNTSMRVTLDSVMCRLMGISDKELGWSGVYEALARLFIQLSIEYGFDLPCRFQAYCWCAYRGKAN